MLYQWRHHFHMHSFPIIQNAKSYYMFTDVSYIYFFVLIYECKLESYLIIINYLLYIYAIIVIITLLYLYYAYFLFGRMFIYCCQWRSHVLIRL